MSGLREYVAKRIQESQEDGGMGILLPEESAALEWAVLSPTSAMECHETQGHRKTLAMLAQELGPSPLRIHGLPTKIDAYYLKCADIAIAAYDAWMDQRADATRKHFKAGP